MGKAVDGGRRKAVRAALMQKRVALLSFFIPAFLVGTSVAGQKPHAAYAKVPFVGCRSDGQVGPHPAPRSGWSPTLPSNVARRLAYYVASESEGVLAPRGWNCFGVYGSNGSALIVSPEPLDPKTFLSEKGFRTRGYAVEWSYNFGGTSGRWAVAHAIARYFPRYRRFITDDFQNLDVGPLPSGPYPRDLLSQRTQRSVRYITPAKVEGEGTAWTLAPSNLPVHGMALLVKESDGPDLLRVNIRVPKEDGDLVAAILHQAERGRPSASGGKQ
jgi:hypothetical protein